MAEYIEREAALEILEKSLTFCETVLDIGEYRDGCIAATQDDIGNIRHIPIADVVPKSEVDNLKVLLEMKEKAYEGLKELYDTDTDALVKARGKTEVEVARELFEEIDEIAHRYLNDADYSGGDMIYDLNELKKKYKGDKNDKRDTV